MTVFPCRKALLPALLPLLALVTISATARAQTTVTTLPAFGGFDTTFPVIGQTFTAPTDNVLTSFAFQLFDVGPLTFSVYAYNDAAAAVFGNVLFLSTPTGNTTVQGQPGYFFDTGNLTLSTGSLYAAVLSGSTTGYGGPLSIGRGDAYTGGKAIAGITPTGPFFDLSAGFGTPVDHGFTATFAPAAVASIPEPSEYAAMGMAGFALCGLMVRARRRKSSDIGKDVPVAA